MSAEEGGPPSGRTIVRQVQWIGAAHSASQVAWYAVYLFLAALLTPSAFGVVAAGLAVLSVAQLLMDSGTGGSLIAARRITRADILSALRLNVGIGVVLTALIALAAGPLTRTLAEGGQADVLRVLALGVTITALGVVPAALLKKALRFKQLALVTAVSTLTTAAVAIVAALLGAGVWALVLRQVVGGVVWAAALWVAAHDLLRRLHTLGADPSSTARPQHRFAFLTIQASLFIAGTFDKLVVGAFTDVEQLGFYALAVTLAFAPLTQLAWVFGQVLFPAAAATAELTEVGRRTVRAIRLSALFLLPLVPAAIVLAAPLLPALLGEEWQDAVVPFQILLVVGVGHALLNPIGESLGGTGNAPLRARLDFAWAIATILAVAVGTMALGIRGAAWAQLATLVPFVAAFAVLGTRSIGTSAAALLGALRDPFLAVSAQALVTGALVAALGGALAGAVAAAGLGLLVGVAILALAPSRPLGDAVALVRLAVPRLTARRAAGAPS